MLANLTYSKGAWVFHFRLLSCLSEVSSLPILMETIKRMKWITRIKRKKRYKDDDNAGGVSSSRLSIMGGVNYVVCLKQQQSPITNFHRHFVPH